MSSKPKIYLSSPHLGTQEFEFVREAFATNWIAPLGPHVDAFEKEFGQSLQEGTELTRIGRKEAQKAQKSEGDGLTTEGGGQSSVLHAAALSSGTAALHLALKLVGLQRGEDVFCSSLTFSASANPIVYEGAKPVFIDSERTSWNMDPALLEKALEDRKKKGKLPRAVILVHLYGQCADIDAIAALCENYGVALIEDAAEALGATYFSRKEAQEAQNRTDSQVSSGLGSSPVKLDQSAEALGATYFSHKKAQEAQNRTESQVSSGLGSSPVKLDQSAEALGATYFSHKKAQEAQNRTESQVSPGLGSSPGDTKQSVITGGIPSSSRDSRKAIAPGTIGRLGIFSFNGNKIITTSGGGMLVSNDESLIKKARFWATQSRDPAPHYQHSEIGYNYRLSNVLAGIGRGQLQVLADRVNARRANCAYYEKAFADLPGISFMPEAPWNRCTRWLTCILVDPAAFGADREEIRLALEAENIEARPVWKPMHLQPVFAACDRFGGEVAEDLFNRGLCLPSGSNLSESDLERVVEVVRRVFARR
jgi:dTDP-4-amino-4,6-dideoxygalactose transaminase